MELGAPGTSPLSPLLLLLLGAGLLPGKFRGAGRTPFRPVQGGLGPPEPEEGRLLAAVPSRGCAQRGSRGGSPSPRPLRVPQTQKTVLRARVEPGEERVNLFGNSKKRIGVGVGEMLFQELDPEAPT